MQDRVGQVWEVQMFGVNVFGAQAALVYVVRSTLESGMHRLLVLDGGLTGWQAGQLKTLGELVEGMGARRIA